MLLLALMKTDSLNHQQKKILNEVGLIIFNELVKRDANSL